ncbi:hypothetical protein YC2023_079700 [Brassica napus]
MDYGTHLDFILKWPWEERKHLKTKLSNVKTNSVNQKLGLLRVQKRNDQYKVSDVNIYFYSLLEFIRDLFDEENVIRESGTSNLIYRSLSSHSCFHHTFFIPQVYFFLIIEGSPLRGSVPGSGQAAGQLHPGSFSLSPKAQYPLW